MFQARQKQEAMRMHGEMEYLPHQHKPRLLHPPFIRTTHSYIPFGTAGLSIWHFVKS